MNERNGKHIKKTEQRAHRTIIIIIANQRGKKYHTNSSSIKADHSQQRQSVRQRRKE